MPSVQMNSDDDSVGIDKPMPFVISFDVKIGEKSYLSVYDRIMGRLAKELSKKSRPHYTFICGEVILAFYDGHPGITRKMSLLTQQLRSDIQSKLHVELPGWGISALNRHTRGNIIRVHLQFWLVYEFYIFPPDRWEECQQHHWDC